MVSQVGRLVRASAVAAVFVAGAMPGSAQAGFLDNLFGASPSVAPNAPDYSYDQPPETFHAAPAARPRASHHKVVVDSRPKRQTPTDLMHDATLQNGDAVMMKDGVHVYIGGDDDKKHQLADFTALDSVDGMGKGERNALVALDATHNDPLRGALTPDTIASGRSAAVAMPAVKGREIVDARGKSVRYVGP